jgi:hypothetical protein
MLTKRSAKALQEARNNSRPGSRDVPGVATLGYAKFLGALTPNKGWMTGAFTDNILTTGDIFGAYTGVYTVSTKPRSKYNADGEADPNYLLHVPLKKRVYRRGKASVRTYGHLYIDAGDPNKSGWCRYINTHAGTSVKLNSVGGCSYMFTILLATYSFVPTC